MLNQCLWMVEGNLIVSQLCLWKSTLVLELLKGPATVSESPAFGNPCGENHLQNASGRSCVVMDWFLSSASCTGQRAGLGEGHMALISVGGVCVSDRLPCDIGLSLIWSQRSREVNQKLRSLQLWEMASLPSWVGRAGALGTREARSPRAAPHLSSASHSPRQTVGWQNKQKGKPPSAC